MAKLDFVERECFENLFGMGSGYLLDFTNRSFQEFIYEKMEIDVYQKYTDISKAKILRRIIQEYDDITVGKLLLDLLRYMQETNKIGKDDQETFAKCAEIGNRMIGRTAKVRRPANTSTPTTPIKSVVDYENYLYELKSLTNFEDTPQARGFEFERYLNNLFGISGLEPRSSFKIVGEQIDGSFILRSEIYLLEAKWTSKKTNKADLVIFNEKVSSKSSFTRGLYISFSGYSDEAISSFATGRTVSIVLMTVEEIAVALSRQMDMQDVIWRKVRTLAEEGKFYKSIFEM